MGPAQIDTSQLAGLLRFKLDRVVGQPKTTGIITNSVLDLEGAYRGALAAKAA